MPRNVAFIEPKRELIDVAKQVLGAGVMVDTVQPALEHSPDGFNAVRAHAVLGVDSSRVIDRLMAKEQPVKADVPGCLIRNLLSMLTSK